MARFHVAHIGVCDRHRPLLLRSGFNAKRFAHLLTKHVARLPKVQAALGDNPDFEKAMEEIAKIRFPCCAMGDEALDKIISSSIMFFDDPLLDVGFPEKDQERIKALFTKGV